MRVITIDNEQRLNSQTIKTVIKRHLLNHGRIADIKIQLTFPIPSTKRAYIKSKVNGIKITAIREMKQGKNIPRVRDINNK